MAARSLFNLPDFEWPQDQPIVYCKDVVKVFKTPAGESTVLKGIMGFGSHGLIQYKPWSMVEHVPVIATVPLGPSVTVGVLIVRRSMSSLLIVPVPTAVLTTVPAINPPGSVGVPKVMV